LDPADLGDSPRRASSIKGAAQHARTVSIEEMQPVDVVVAGCVAVGLDGARLGKGGGFSDLEFALASQAGLIGPHTIVVTTVHELQVRPAGVVPMQPPDIWVDGIVTPDRVVRCRRQVGRQRGELYWDRPTDEKVTEIPLLQPL